MQTIHRVLCMLVADMPTPPDEVIEAEGKPDEAPCCDCQAAVWVAPRSVHFIKEGLMTPICIPCAVKSGLFENSLMVKLPSLPTEH